MRKLMISCIVLLLMVSLIGCSNNVDRDASKPEDKTEQKENDAKTVLMELQKNLDSKKKITATLNNKASLRSDDRTIMFEEEGTYETDNVKASAKILSHISEGGQHVEDMDITITINEDGITYSQVGGTYPFSFYRYKFSDFLNAESEITYSTLNERNTYSYQIGNAYIELEIDDNDLLVKLSVKNSSTLDNGNIKIDDEYEYTNFTFE